MKVILSQRFNNRLGAWGMIFFLFCATVACTSVKPYQKAYLNDYYMDENLHPITKNERNTETYREGASGGTGGKSSAGCGCY